MTTLMEHKILNNKVLSFSEDYVFENLAIPELIELAVDTVDNDPVILKSRQELTNRGKDNIQLRITIKKTFKTMINELGVLLKELDCGNSADKDVVKLYKNKFLNIISLLDKLQLGWQKHDLFLTR